MLYSSAGSKSCVAGTIYEMHLGGVLSARHDAPTFMAL